MSQYVWLNHRIVNEVHCISHVVEHASEGHEQISILVTFQEAGRNSAAKTQRVHLLKYLQVCELKETETNSQIYGHNKMSPHTLCIWCIW